MWYYLFVGAETLVLALILWRIQCNGAPINLLRLSILGLAGFAAFAALALLAEILHPSLWGIIVLALYGTFAIIALRNARKTRSKSTSTRDDE